MYLNYIMRSLLEIVKDWFRVQFRMPVLFQRSGTSIETNDDGTIPIETCNCHWAIMDAKKKTIWDYYFNLANKKPIHKHVYIRVVSIRVLAPPIAINHFWNVFSQFCSFGFWY